MRKIRISLILEKAQKLFKKGKYSEAETEFRKVLALKPTNKKILIDIHRELGASLFYQEKHTEAEKEFHKALALKPRSKETLAGIHKWLGSVLYSQGKFAEAEAEFRKVLALKPRSKRTLAAIHGWLGLVLYSQGKFAEAEAEFRKELALKPKDKEVLADIHWLLGKVLYSQEKFAEAEAELHKALAYKPKDKEILTDIHSQLGWVLFSQEKYAEAEAELHKALALEPRDKEILADIHRQLGWILSFQKKYIEGEAEFRMALALEPRDEEILADIHHRLGYLHSFREKHIEAEEEFRKALALKPKDKEILADIHRQLGCTLSLQKKYDEAEEEFRKALVLKPADKEALIAIHYWLGVALFSQRKHIEAEEEFRKALALNPVDKEALLVIGYGLGLTISSQKKRTELETELLREASSITMPKLAPIPPITKISIIQSPSEIFIDSTSLRPSLRISPGEKKRIPFEEANLRDSIQRVFNSAFCFIDNWNEEAIENLRHNSKVLSNYVSLDSCITEEDYIVLDLSGEGIVDSPLELLHFKDNFLCLEKFIGRTCSEKQKTPNLQDTPVKMTIIANPCGTVPEAEDEAKTIKEELSDLIRNNQIRIEVINSISPLDLQKIMEEVDILHFAGHADFDPQTGKGYWLLSDNRKLTPTELATVEHPPMLIFANACESGKVKHLDQKRWFYKSLANLFIKEGFPHYIATMFPVPSSLCIPLAVDFYRELAKGKSIGESLTIARRKAYDTRNPIWVAYMLYGDPRDKIWKT